TVRGRERGLRGCQLGQHYDHLPPLLRRASSPADLQHYITRFDSFEHLQHLAVGEVVRRLSVDRQDLVTWKKSSQVRRGSMAGTISFPPTFEQEPSLGRLALGEDGLDEDGHLAARRIDPAHDAEAQ